MDPITRQSLDTYYQLRSEGLPKTADDLVRYANIMEQTFQNIVNYPDQENQDIKQAIQMLSEDTVAVAQIANRIDAELRRSIQSNTASSS